MMGKTYVPKRKDLKQYWHIVDATDIRLGRLATEVSGLLTGKGKVDYMPNALCGDHVIVINCTEISVYPKKQTDKMYYTHSGYLGNLKEYTFKDQMKKNPKKIIEYAVKGMLPNNKMRKKLLKNLHVFADGNHKYDAQKPKIYKIK